MCEKKPEGVSIREIPGEGPIDTETSVSEVFLAYLTGMIAPPFPQTKFVHDTGYHLPSLMGVSSAGYNSHGDLGHFLYHRQAIGPQCLPRLDNIEDAVADSQQRCQFYGTMQMDDFHSDALV
jgi:hypothetical protein